MTATTYNTKVLDSIMMPIAINMMDIKLPFGCAAIATSHSVYSHSQFPIQGDTCFEVGEGEIIVSISTSNGTEFGRIGCGCLSRLPLENSSAIITFQNNPFGCSLVPGNMSFISHMGSITSHGKIVKKKKPKKGKK